MFYTRSDRLADMLVDADISEEQMVAMGAASSCQSQITFTPNLVVDELAELLLFNGGDEHWRSLKNMNRKGMHSHWECGQKAQCGRLRVPGRELL